MAKVGPFGIPIMTAEDHADMEKEGYWRACARVTDVDPTLGPPELRARRIIINCLMCDAEIWFDPDPSYPKGGKSVCLQCLLVVAANAAGA